MGGKAFSGETRQVSKQEVYDTIHWLEGQWPDHAKNPKASLIPAMLGSAGKVDFSGDIDLNLSITAYDQAEVAAQMVKLLGESNVKPRPGNNQIFTSMPINGDPNQGRVQVDLMFGDYNWQNFSYFSPKQCDSSLYWGTTNHSFFKGLYRTEYIKALTAFNSDWILSEDDKVVARVGPTFFHDRGLVWRYRHRPMRQDGTARVQDFKELTEAEFKAIYPSSFSASNSVIIDVEQAMEFLTRSSADGSGRFRRSYAKGGNHFDTIEGLAAMAYYCYNTSEFNKINKIYLERLNSLKVDIPVKDLKYINIR